MTRNSRDHLLHMAHDRGEIDRWRRGAKAERGVGARRLDALGRREQRFRGHAAVIEAIAAHPAALDQHRAHTELRGAGSDGEPAGARADDADIDINAPAHGAARGCRRACCHL
jgi:hypothetical protein